jgi:hypothetical protein
MKSNIKITKEMVDMDMFDFEDITDMAEDVTRIMLRVPGGWVYEVTTGIGVAVTFVPLPVNHNQV